MKRITNANFWQIIAMGASVGVDLGSVAQQYGHRRHYLKTEEMMN